MASVQTIGYICEELESKDLNSEQRELVLSVLINSIESDNLELEKIGISSLYHAIEYTSEIFANRKGSIVFDAILKSCKSSDEDISTYAFQCIVEVVRYHYEFINEFVDLIADYTFGICKISDQSDSAKAQAMEIWTSIAEEECDLERTKSHHHDLIRKNFDDLVKTQLEVLTHFDFFEEMESEWGASTSAACGLRHVASLVGNEVVPMVTNYAGEKISSDNPKEIFEGLMALGAILLGPDKAYLEDQFKPAMDQLINLLGHNNV